MAARAALLVLPLLLLLSPLPAQRVTGASPQGDPYSPTTTRWRAADHAFDDWTLSGLERAADGSLRLLTGAGRSTVQSPYAPGAAIYSGEAVSPVIGGRTFWQAVPSWTASVPTGGWMDIQLRVRRGGGWSHWYYLGIWTEGDGGNVRRQSVAGQEDDDVRIDVDTLKMKHSAADGVQILIRLLSDRAEVRPQLNSVSLVVSNRPPSAPPLSSGDPALWGRRLDLPACSQMVYPDGGEIWCSPTSVGMVLGYWRGQRGAEVGSCASRVLAAVNGVYDFVYEGHGNWPFNTAYAAREGLDAYVTRLPDLAAAERWIARGVPVVLSYGWAAGELDGAPLPFSFGHLAVLSGFDATGQPIVHDPAGASDGAVVHTYRRDQLERLWLEHSGGTVYIIAPPHRLFDVTERHYLPLAIAP